MSTDLGRVRAANEALPTAPLTIIAATLLGGTIEETYVRLAEVGNDPEANDTDLWFCIEDRMQWDLDGAVAEWRILALPTDQINQEAFHAAAHQ